jgi:hypothetical protein
MEKDAAGMEKGKKGERKPAVSSQSARSRWPRPLSAGEKNIKGIL